MSREGRKRCEKPFSGFSYCSGMPSLSSQPRTVTTPTETQAARSIGGPIHFDASPSLKLFSSARSQNKSSTKLSSTTQKNEKIALSKLKTGARVWNVTDENVPVLPECHPLERTAVFVPHTSAPVVSERVTECLKSRSISAEFIVGKSVKAKCLTADSPPVEFRVFLYRGKKTYSHGIIVEVQRRFGFSMNFAADTTAILDAAEDKQSSTAPLFLPLLVPLSSDSESSDDDVEASPSFVVAQEMLESSDISKRLLGIEFFLSQTNSQKIGASKSSVVTRRLLSKECAATLKIFIELSVGSDESLRANALSIWANMFSSLTKKDLPLVNMHKSFIIKNLIPTLFEQVKNADKNTRNANFALRCLYNLLKNFSNCVLHPILKTDNLMDILDNARKVGASKNVSLSRHVTLFSGMLERAF